MIDCPWIRVIPTLRESRRPPPSSAREASSRIRPTRCTAWRPTRVTRAPWPVCSPSRPARRTRAIPLIAGDEAAAGAGRAVHRRARAGWPATSGRGRSRCSSGPTRVWCRRVHSERRLVAVRVPDSVVARALAHGGLGGLITATSANRSGSASDRRPRRRAASSRRLRSRPAARRGPRPGGAPSTIVDVTGRAAAARPRRRRCRGSAC